MEENEKMRVYQLKDLDFGALPLAKQLQVKNIGRPTPNIQIAVFSKHGDGKLSYQCRFDRKMYDRASWICGCEKTNTLYCYVCLLYGNHPCEWTEEGFKDINLLTEMIHEHENTPLHKNNFISFQILGRDLKNPEFPSIPDVISRGQKKAVRNRKILCSLMDVLKLCAKCGLSLGGKDGCRDGVFAELLQHTRTTDAFLDKCLSEEHDLEPTSKGLQNNLLRCMREVCRDRIAEEVKAAPFVSLLVDDTSDVSAEAPVSLVLRYEKDNRVHERFWGFVHPEPPTAESLAKCILQKLEPVLAHDPWKLIAQAYSGECTPRSEVGVQARVKSTYPNAHYLDSYAHPLSRAVEQVACGVPSARTFFAKLNGIALFFAKSVDRRLALKHVCDRARPVVHVPEWDLRTRTVYRVSKFENCILDCFEGIAAGKPRRFDAETVRQASAHARDLVDNTFLFWLGFFADVMAHTEALSQALQLLQNDPDAVPSSIYSFQNSIMEAKQRLKPGADPKGVAKREAGEGPPKRRRALANDALRLYAMEVCDAVMRHTQERFAFRNHLFGERVFKADMADIHARNLPHGDIDKFCDAYPTLKRHHLKVEMKVFLERSEIERDVRTSYFKTLGFVQSLGLEATFREISKALKILVTLPTTTMDAERCPGTVKFVRSYLRKNPNEDCLTSLTMLAVEWAMVQDMLDFNQKVLAKLAADEKMKHVCL